MRQFQRREKEFRLGRVEVYFEHILLVFQDLSILTSELSLLEFLDEVGSDVWLHKKRLQRRHLDTLGVWIGKSISM